MDQSDCNCLLTFTELNYKDRKQRTDKIVLKNGISKIKNFVPYLINESYTINVTNFVSLHNK